MTLDAEEMSAAELLVARIAANTSPSAALAFSGHFLTSGFGRALSATEARICDGALLILTRTERQSVRAQLATILACVASGPVRTVTHLAYDLDAEVAGPLLRHSALIGSDDLAAIARLRSQRHLTAIAGRDPLSPELAQIIKARIRPYGLRAGRGATAAQVWGESPPDRRASAEHARVPEGRLLDGRSALHLQPDRRDRAGRPQRIAAMTLRLIEGGRRP